MKFKVGDKVRCIKGEINHEGGTPGGHGWKLGLEFTIRSITPYSDTQVYWGGYKDNGVYEDWLEPATPKVSNRKLGKWAVKL